jgi:Flp pilus assembly protein TadG
MDMYSPSGDKDKMLNGFANRGKRSIGQGMVELALTLPLFLLLLYGIFEIGRLVFMYSAVLNASRDAARYAAAADAVMANDAGYQEYYKDCEGIRTRAQTVSAFVNLSASDAVTISYDSGPGTGSIETSCEALRSSGKTLALGDRVNVTVTAIFSPIVPLLNIGEIPVSSTTTRSIVAGINIWDD